MEENEKESTEVEEKELTVDLSNQSLKKIERASEEQKEATSLILDENEIQRLENIDSYPNLKKLSISSNNLIRMYGVSHVTTLTVLNLSNNSIVTIEGLKELKHLKHLNLAGNKIKTIDHLNGNLDLEVLDLNENNITHISDISFLQNLQELYLHNNRISHLQKCEKNLPVVLEKLTLNNNAITDLTEISHLVHLTALKELTFKNNPCLDYGCGGTGFNYRPYIKNWCCSITVLDGYPLTDIECLKAEWLYSQGKGRCFRQGEHIELAKYLCDICPKPAEHNLECEDEKKLRLILSKAQQHQQQLKEQLTTGHIPLPNRHKLPLNKKKAAGLSERMVSSYHDSVSKDNSRNSPDLMTRSLDSAMLENSPPPPRNSTVDLSCQSPLQTATTLVPVPESLTSPDVVRPLHPLLTPNTPRSPHPYATSCPSRSSYSSSRNSPYSTPETKRKATNVLKRQNVNSSPAPTRKYGTVSSPYLGKSASGHSVASPKKNVPIHSRTEAAKKAHLMDKETSEEEEDSEMSASKLQSIQQRANQKRHKKHVVDNRQVDSEEKENFEKKNKKNEKESKDSDIWKAALCIQRRWRGYRTRHLNSEVVAAYKNIQTNRIQDYIIKVATDMEATRVALEGNRKLQVLQMQAINALWKKMATLQPGEGGSGESKDTLQGLAETCLSLNKQVEELQTMMKVMHHANPCDSVPIATQTEIIAVHTPQGEAKEIFPYHTRLERPSNLPITQPPPEPVEQYATSLASDVIKSLSSTGSGPDSCLDFNEAIMELDNNSNFKEPSPREESVCLTPACQEGKDLQVSAASLKTNSENLLKPSDGNGQKTETMESQIDGNNFSSQNNDASPAELTSNDQEYKNGCPSS